MGDTRPMHNIIEEIRSMASMDAGPNWILTLYVDNHWDDYWGREETRTYFKDQSHKLRKMLERMGRDEIPKVLTDMNIMDNYLDDVIWRGRDVGSQGIVRFLCSSIQLDRTFKLAGRFQNSISVAKGPQLGQLIRMAEDLPSSIIVLVDSQSVRIVELVEGMPELDQIITADVPGRHKQGGWSQLHYQRHIAVHTDRVFKEGADHLVRLFDENRRPRFLIGGPEALVAQFSLHLPKRALDKMANLDGAEPTRDWSKVLEKARQVLTDLDKQDVHQSLDRVQKVALTGGKAVLGRQDVLNALNMQKVHVLYLADNLKDVLFLCSNCSFYTQEGDGGRCPSCDGRTEAQNPLEDLPRLAVGQGCVVRMVADSPVLAMHEGMAAWLRW